MGHDAAILEQLPPEKLLGTSNYRVISPAIRMMGEVETVEQYLKHERAKQNRGGIIRRLSERRDAIYEERAEAPPERTTETGGSSTPPVEVEIPIENPDDLPVRIQVEPTTRTETETPASFIPPSLSADLLALVHEHGPTGVARSPEAPAWDEL
ncbi:hypothetical protein EXE51_08475 [Halorubrum sp. CGM5_25_10-8B]|uniref:hypothetical protein n=1 Tax=Halorubrum sp. CGM5_25_10-8B TaxID=2518115 RepID=UPI0010F4EEBA|nr:hypothetical protein [Halorubrum sp. CGM5_25_10-8B]TKX37094.1 hypothetical protein EXE51_08475 [Halorubrum sp. CGM5_25_10-8B]